jgi:hypothetical protein
MSDGMTVAGVKGGVKPGHWSVAETALLPRGAFGGWCMWSTVVSLVAQRGGDLFSQGDLFPSFVSEYKYRSGYNAIAVRP